MMVHYVFLDHSNKEQVKWWTKIGRKFVRVCGHRKFVKRDTNEVQGFAIAITGFFSRIVKRKMDRFHTNPKTIKVLD